MPALSQAQAQLQNAALLRASPSPAAGMTPSQTPHSSQRAVHQSVPQSTQP